MFYSRPTVVAPSTLGLSNQDITNWGGEQMPIVRFMGTTWIVKVMSSQAVKRELLVYKLGRRFCNMPKIRKVNHRLLKALHAQGIAINGTVTTTLLIQLAQSMQWRKLPQKSADSAVAAEFVLSLWIRRRDVSAWNKTYLENNIPVFYDLNACLDFEEDLRDIHSFFSRNKNGYAGSWRVSVLRPGEILTTLEARAKRDHRGYVTTKEGFLKGVDCMIDIVKHIRVDRIGLFRDAGYGLSEAVAIRDYLCATQKTIEQDAELMKQVLFSAVQPNTERR